MGLVILKKDRKNSKSYEEAEELARQRYIKNRNCILYKNLRKILNDARQYSDVSNYDNEMYCLKGVLFGIDKRIAELEQKGIGLTKHEDLERVCKYCNQSILKSLYQKHLDDGCIAKHTKDKEGDRET